MRNPVYVRALRRAAQIKGGHEALAVVLGVPPGELTGMLNGTAAIPPDVFLRTVDILLGDSTMVSRPGANDDRHAG